MTREQDVLSTHALKPGEKLKLCNTTNNTVEVIVEEGNGTKVQFNLIVGHCINIYAGATNLKVKIDDFNEELVGVTPTE